MLKWVKCSFKDWMADNLVQWKEKHKLCFFGCSVLIRLKEIS